MKYILFIVFACLPQMGMPQIYKHIETNTGLGSRKTYCIQEDKLGYMWFLTDEGIERYDGKRVKHYDLTDGNAEIVAQANLNWVYMDGEGILWIIGRMGRIFRYDKNRDCFQLEYKLPESQIQNRAYTLNFAYLDSFNRVWLCKKDSIVLYDLTTHRPVKQLKHQINEITCIEQADSVNFYVGTSSGLYQMIWDCAEAEPVLCRKVDGIHERISEIHFHPSSRKLFIGTFQDGLLIYDPYQPSDISKDTFSEDANVTRIVSFSDKEILIATQGKGVFRMNVDSCKAMPYIRANYDSYNEMNVNNINDLFVDGEKRIWLVNEHGGITIRDNRYANYKWIKHSVGNVSSLINDQVYDIIEDSDGDVWFGTGNGVSLYRRKTCTWHSFLSAANGKAENMNRIFIALCEVAPGMIWVGGYTSGIYQIDKRRLSVEYVSPLLTSLSNLEADQYIRDIKLDSQGCIWSGGYNSLKCYNPTVRKARQYEGLHSIKTILEKDDKNMWIGTSTGLYLLDKESGLSVAVDFPFGVMNVCTLCQTGDSILYIGTNGLGLIRYNSDNESVVRYHTDNCALISNKVFTIIPREDGKLLLGTEKGVTLFSPRTRKFRNWTKEQGLRSTGFNAGAGVLCSDGNCILGSNDGAVSFPADLQIPRPRFSRIILSDFHILYHPVYPGDKNSPLASGIDETYDLRLKYSQNTFSMIASTINYDFPSNVLYSWKLEGYDKKWSTPSVEGIIRYTNLDPGKYLLHIRALSGEDPDSEFEAREMRIFVAQSPWLGTWAIMGYVLLTVILSAVFVYVLKWRRQKKVADEKAQFFIHTAHDIRTPLTLIKAPLEEILVSDGISKDIKEHMRIALKNVQVLLRQSANLINLGRIDIYSSKLYVAEYELNEYMKDICSAFRAYADAKHIDFSYESNFKYLNVWFDRDKMDSIVKNLLSNAMKYTPEYGKVRVSAEEQKDTWEIEVSDSGIGIPPQEQKKIFRSSFRASNALQSDGNGIGLVLVRKLVGLHKGKVFLKSAVDRGTSVRVIFRKGHDHFRSVGFMRHIPAEWVTLIPETEISDIPRSENGEGERLPHRILVVEDNEDLCAYLKDLLSGIYEVEVCCNGKQALELLPEFKPELILSDILMSEMRGDELCMAIKSNVETSHIPVILLTALSGEQNVMKGLKVGADDYISKPFSVSLLLTSINNVLSNRALLRRKYSNLDFDEEPEKESLSDALDRQFMSSVKEIVEKNISNPEFNVDTLCRELHMSRTSFYNKLKALIDCSPSDYIRTIRLKYSAQLLEGGGHTVFEVAVMSGFCDSKYFREVFKKHFNMCPSEYAKKYKKVN